MGNITGLLAALARGGLQFMLIIWLQGIWLPQHGYSFERTPLWAGIYMIPLTVGFLISGPLSGGWPTGSARGRSRPAGIDARPARVPAVQPAADELQLRRVRVLLLLVGLSMGLFFAPNTASVMNSLPADQRGAGAGMLNTFQNSAQVLSIGVFFTVITLGLAARLPHALNQGLVARACRRRRRTRSRTCRRSARCSRRSSATTRSSSCSARRRAAHVSAAALRVPDRPRLLPASDRRAVRARPAPGVQSRPSRRPSRSSPPRSAAGRRAREAAGA